MRSSRAQALLLLGALTALLGACAYANGYDPARYAAPPPAASTDPEIEPLAPSPKRRMRDPRGAVIVRAAPADASVAMVANAPAAATDFAAPGVTCGSRTDPCPMQRFMHGALATAHTAETLTAAFTRVAGMSPDPAWSWVAIATRGADLANAGDLAGAKAQCGACHAAYREPYRARYRSRAL